MTSISTASLASAPRLSVMQAQAALAKAQIEVSNGGRLADIGLGLGGSTGTYVSLTAQGSRLQTLIDSNSVAATKLTAATTALDSLRSTASSFFSSLTAAATSGAVSSTLVTTAGANLGSLTATLNTSVNGEAIFGGINTSVAPMTTYAAGAPAKAAVDDSFSSTFAGTTQDSDAASAISGTAMQDYLSNQFASLFTASNYGVTWSAASDQNTSAQISTTETVDTSVSANSEPIRQLAQAYTMVKEFGGANFGSAAGQAVIATASGLVSSALAGLTTAEAGIGLSQSAVSSASDRMTSQVSYLSTQADGMVSVDPAALSIKISGLQTQIQASYEITSQLQQLSLVNYLK